MSKRKDKFIKRWKLGHLPKCKKCGTNLFKVDPDTEKIECLICYWKG